MKQRLNFSRWLILTTSAALLLSACGVQSTPTSTPAERNERAMQLLDLVGIAEHAHKLPNHLAGGQQQRAAIARALANDPPIIATDEPTGNLDWTTAESVMNLFENLVAQGKTILMVTHDDDLAARAARTIALADGEIVSEQRRR